MREAIRFEHITKTFGDVVANKDVSFTVERGKIYAILGENGSGKTTLMNVIAGLYQQDSGDVYVNGEKANINSPRDAYAYKVGMVHQHFKLVDVFTASENITLGVKREDNAEYKILKEEEKELGTINDIKKQIKALKKEMKKENLLISDQLQKKLTEYNTNLETIKNLKRNEALAARFNLKKIDEKIKRIADRYGFVVDPKKHVYDMPVSEKQTLEIVKVLYRGVDILILDEPTAVLTPQETEHLFNALRSMREHGNTVIIITHKLNEVLEISDKIVVLRKGKYVGEIETKKANVSKLTEMMVGKKVELNIHRSEPKNPTDRLIIKDLCLKNKDDNYILKDINFTVRSGEILGIAGISGNGQRELLESIAGLKKINTGNITFINPKKNQPVTLFHKDVKRIKELASNNTFHSPDGKPIDLNKKKKKEIIKMIDDKQIIFNEDEIVDLKDHNPLEIRQLGIHLSFVPEDRLGMGLVGDMSITDNMMLRSYRKGKGIVVNRAKPAKLADDIIKELNVVTPSKDTKVRLLSGGNIQKVLVGREIAYAPKVLMTAYPVRGLDVNSSYAIYDLLEKQKQKGVGIIYVGEDLDVLLALCDRILVLSQGEVAGIFNPKKVSKEKIGLYMTKGGKVDEEAKN